MRDIKELLQILCDVIKSENPKDGEAIWIHAYGLCRLIELLVDINIITRDEQHVIIFFIEKEIAKSDYKAYPLTWRKLTHKQQDTSFFFKKCNWSIRIQWLEEVISKL